MKFLKSRILVHSVGSLVLALVVLSLSPHSAGADQVILDDLVVDGSICVGMDCVNGESFGFDTLRLKENNLRIRAVDTSNSASFPTHDWQITFNDSSNGGANKFSIDHIDSGKTPFTIEGNAPSHSLYVDDGGKVGLGTSMPVVELHMTDGDTPTIRLDQDGSSGWSQQVWDVAGNETNFFVRDVTNGSKLPFRIRPNAPSSSIDIASDGDVGVGTASPAADLHVVGKGGGENREVFMLENNGPVQFVLEDVSANETWKFANNNGFRINETSSSGSEFLLTQAGELIVGLGGTQKLFLDTDGNLTINGSITTAGTSCGGGCDIVFDQGVKIDSIEEHAAKMWENSFLPAVGPTIENAPFDLTVKTGGMLNELEKAHIYIEQLNQRLKQREDQLEQMSSRLAKLEELVTTNR